MKTKEVEKYFGFLPEAFYDILTFLIPSAYLVIGVTICFPMENNDIWTLPILNTWVWSLFGAFFVFGGLYTIGLVLTTFSYYVIFAPIMVMRGEKLKYKLDKNYLKTKVHKESISIEFSKRYVRLLLLRNVSFSSFVLCCIYLYFHSWVYLKLSLFIFVITYASTAIRFCWLSNNIEFLNKDCESSQEHKQ